MNQKQRDFAIKQLTEIYNDKRSKLSPDDSTMTFFKEQLKDKDAFPDAIFLDALVEAAEPGYRDLDVDLLKYFNLREKYSEWRDKLGEYDQERQKGLKTIYITSKQKIMFAEDFEMVEAIFKALEDFSL